MMMGWKKMSVIGNKIALDLDFILWQHFISSLFSSRLYKKMLFKLYISTSYNGFKLHKFLI